MHISFTCNQYYKKVQGIYNSIWKRLTEMARVRGRPNAFQTDKLPLGSLSSSVSTFATYKKINYSTILFTFVCVVIFEIFYFFSFNRLYIAIHYFYYCSFTVKCRSILKAIYSAFVSQRWSIKKSRLLLLFN